MEGVNRSSSSVNWGDVHGTVARKDKSNLPKIAVIAKRIWKSCNRESAKGFICNVVIPEMGKCAGIIAAITGVFFLICVPVGHKLNSPDASIFLQPREIIIMDGVVGGAVLAVGAGIWGCVYVTGKLVASCAQEFFQLLRSVPQHEAHLIDLESVFVKKDA